MTGRKQVTKKKRAAKQAALPAPRRDDAAQARRALRVVVICYLFLAAVYATAIPFGAAPDETAHLRYLEYLSEHHQLPVFDREDPDPNYEFHQPPLYYLVALPTHLLSARNPEVQGQTVRFVGVLLGLGLVYLTFALARQLVPDRPWTAVVAAAIVAFLPMHLHLAASVGNDVLAEVLAAGVLVLVVGVLRTNAEYREGRRETPPALTGPVLIGLLIGFSLLTKTLGVLLLPVAWLGLALAGRGPERYEWRRAVRDIAVVTAVALVIAGPWLVRNHLLYGDPLAQQAFLEGFKGRRPSPQDIMRRFPFLGLTGYLQMVAVWTFASTLGVFGPVSAMRFVFYPWPVYAVAAVICLAATIGFLRHMARRQMTGWQAHAWVVFAAFGALLLASFVRFNFDFFQAQARYLFPVLPATALAFVLGVEGFAPARWRRWVSLSVAVLLAALALFGLSLWIVPRFGQ